MLQKQDTCQNPDTIEGKALSVPAASALLPIHKTTANSQVTSLLPQRQYNPAIAFADKTLKCEAES